MEQRDQGEYGGAVQGGVVYASADFPDADTNDIKPQASLKVAISNVILYHVTEAAEKQQQFRQWRRKVKDIIQNHEEKILQFFAKPLPDDQPLKTAHILLTKYGKLTNFDTARQIPQFFRNFIVDSPQNGTDTLNVYIEELMKTRVGENPVQRWINMSKQLLDYMRDTGDELIRLDQRLQSECIRIDMIAEKVSQLVSLPNPEIDGFQEMMDSYIEKQFQSSNFEKLYWDYIFTLQKYSALRDILLPQRTVTQSDPLCCICMTEPIVIALAPCGHTFCTNCSKRTVVCHICRQGVVSRLRVFFS
uniref:RING-type domain-containing protein n=1 Tax=viral metagenome TaxID=1070528 RepID=A0A6C0AMD6_9ZZZZ